MAKTAAPASLETRLVQMMNTWTKRLGLEAWNISLSVRDDLDCFGRAKASIAGLCASIELRHPESIPQDWRGNKDIEVTLVHELLHVRNANFEPAIRARGNKRRGLTAQYEQSLELTAQALVAASRGTLKVACP